MVRPVTDAGPPGAPSVPIVGDDGLAQRLERWAAEARVVEAAERRSRERWLRQQAEEGVTVAGVLADLAERRLSVAVGTRGGRRHRGVVRGVGADFLALATAQGDVLVARSAVASLRTPPGVAPVLGARAARGLVRLAEVLAGMASDRERVVLVAAGGDPVAGTLVTVGSDLAIVRVPGELPVTVYVPLVAIEEVVIDAGGDPGGW